MHNSGGFSPNANKKNGRRRICARRPECLPKRRYATFLWNRATIRSHKLGSTGHS